MGESSHPVADTTALLASPGAQKHIRRWKTLAVAAVGTAAVVAGVCAGFTLHRCSNRAVAATVGPDSHVCGNVVLGNNVTIGARANIACGVSIGANTLLGNDVTIGEGVQIGADNYIFDGVSLRNTSVGRNNTLLCESDSESCRLTLRNCRVGDDAVVVHMGTLDAVDYHQSAITHRHARAVDRNNCRASKADTSQCCRRTGLRLVIVYDLCLDNDTAIFVPVVASARPCVDGDCIPSNSNVARRALADCPTGLADAGFAFGLGDTLAPTTNFLISDRSCLPPPTGNRRRASVFELAGVARGGFKFNAGRSLFNLLDEIKNQDSTLQGFLADQGSLYIEADAQLYPLLKNQVLVSISIDGWKGTGFDYNLWMTNFLRLNPNYEALDFFNRTACNKIIALISTDPSTLVADRANLRLVGPGKVDTVVYYNSTGGQYYTACKRREPWVRLRLPFGQGDDDFECVNDGDNRVIGWCNATDTPLPDGTETEDTVVYGDSRKSHWGDWTSWTVCTGPCGDDQADRARYRTCKGKASKCKGDSMQKKSCTIKCVATAVRENPKGQEGEWGAWGPCSAKCGGGLRTRYRVCVDGPCDKEETQSCNVPACCYGGVIGFKLQAQLGKGDAQEYMTAVAQRVMETCGLTGANITFRATTPESNPKRAVAVTCSQSLFDNVAYLLRIGHCSVLATDTVRPTGAYFVAPGLDQYDIECPPGARASRHAGEIKCPATGRRDSPL